MKTGGQLIVDTLKANGVERLFCVPGESYLAVLDALVDSGVGVTVCRQEGGAAMMADSWGRLTGKPGICFVTRGPGATNAAAGLHIARQDSIPMILFIGQVQRDAREREAFQEVEYRRAFTEFAKWVGEIDDPARIPEFVNRAFSVALSGRPGPVVLSLPEDVLRETVAKPPVRILPNPVPANHPGKAEMTDLAERISKAERPIIILGGTRWTEAAVHQVRHFAERAQIPVGCSFRRQMLFDHLHPCYAGDVGIGINPALAHEISSSDLVMLVGGRFSEMPSSGYTLLSVPFPSQPLVHVHADSGELGRVYRPALAINADPASFAEALSELDVEVTPARAGRVARMHEEYLSWSMPPETGPGDVHMGPIITWLRDNLPEDAILTNGAGNYATWVHRYIRFRKFATQAAPASGSMGYGVPAAVAAQQAFPERLVVAFAGDGCFMMHGQEFATAIQHKLPIIVIVVNNSMYGTIRMHQERDYPGRVSATDLVNPDFAALARAYGGHGETVEKTEDFVPAFERARASGIASIIEIKLDQQAITPTRTLDQISGTGVKKAD
ncbi:MAG: thiamine pyrophosphate-binding protein [Hoeflea sp.]|uniref:thiamine pyrophosphate-binding protein n=1 Tax=Hoeflea sp. TaxID=1940281 RepID=UPI001D7F8149|nr:thiamine pyrophosphate-binding protein [Hoeflea sp.]MBU4529944.1 thiamine pyrophosphate-binding protein [Alphaproteobacteria bacterium]MBU4543171.1 thiamine pyrophosphate-binding protein [Alphaproteobacteria bacterium]MBU4550289.1 thiamine pyrophosphate-binding protein [Alphaproteobacteria bacterium]MBV1722437.1 thiamine pyrophosphate-binding protein [Hoeflea sp.]MBV1761587.1 thiamine pyrophosphate-binding protein [Hoeflea sp.]